MEKVQYHFKVTFTCLIVFLITQNAFGSHTEPPIVINTRPVPNEITGPADHEVPHIDGSNHNDKDNSLSKCSEPMMIEGMTYEPVKDSYMPNDTIRYSCRNADTENVFVVYKCLPDKSWVQIDDYGRAIQSTDIVMIPQCINVNQCPLLRKFHNDTGVIHNTDILLKAKCSYTITVNKGSRILLTFKNSNTGISVLIYDGVNNLGNLIGQWKGTSEVPYDTIESYNRTVFVEVDTTNTSRASPFTIEFATVSTQSQDVECPAPEKPNFGFIIGKNFTIGESVEFDCEPFFLLTPSTPTSQTITCIDDGGEAKWSNDFPQCVGTCPSELDPIQIMDNGSIASANYPEDYGPNQECTWAVTGKTAQRFILTFKTLLTNQDDLLKLIDGSDSKRRLQQIECTKQNCSGVEFQTQTNTFEIQFQSGSSPFTGSKFLIEFKPLNESESVSTNSPTNSPASTSVSSTNEITSLPSTKVSQSTLSSTTPPSTTSSTTPPSTTFSTTPPNTTFSRIPPSTTFSTTPPSTTPSTTATRGTTPLFGSSTVTFQVITFTTNVPITEKNKGPPTNTGIIVAAVVIPVLTICIGILLVYLLWYRRKHPVRLGLGRRETQVENPMYKRPRRTSTATLMLDPNELPKINGQLQLGIINNGLDPENPDNSPTFNRKTPLA
ncbi:unnamed protein product [Owenia fusiformis]|uniref:Uncharacterized protein n=1 Tax=Owenia fusiformis TaxID=6347 RepID=A0A8J1TB55_OWEFU|nr:unnamed protein product [Owenia fusiformis]